MPRAARYNSCGSSQYNARPILGGLTKSIYEPSMNRSANYDPDNDFLAGFTSTDGTIEFFGRVSALLKPSFTVLDLGAGRGAWFYTDQCEYRRSLRTIKGRVREFICADIHEVVLTNPTSDKNILIKDSRIPLEDSSVDLIVCDYVLEHVLDVNSLKNEISRLLKPNGYFCARTPHQLNYVCFFARIVSNVRHAKILSLLQPTRQPEDVFPTAYKLNSLRRIRRVFPGWGNYSYLFTSEPRYFFGLRFVYRVLQILHDHAPKLLTGNLFIFLRKQ
jgi:SAM-dependent methyltransferase